MSDAPGPAPEDARNWVELQRLFHLLDGQPPAARERLLEENSADEALRARVRELLCAADEVPEPAAPEAAAATVGPWRLIRQIGAGGIGTVYLAERLADGTALRAALKLLAPYAVDATFLERFQREQHNLAALDHPNITRLVDAGWTEGGQPYLVMEYVDGQHVDAYCDAQRLGLKARLRLFLQVCAAVGDAHRHLIVHLDLKPSNVIVGANGIAKLLDFGTSRLLQMQDGETATVTATPAYASPEQLLGRPVSTASDVYGLGAILFALLAGRAPFPNTSLAGRVESAFREAEPPLLQNAATLEAAAGLGFSEARLRQALAGDLAAIVATCLQPRPQDRYRSVEALADDVQRYLDCQPVLTRRQTLVYRAGKFLRRHRVAASLAAAAALSLVLMLSYAWVQQQAALREATRAVRMQTFLYSLFKMANPNYTGKPVATVPEFLRAGMSRLPDLIHEPSDLRQAELGLAESMYESGDDADARAAFARVIAAADRAGARADKAEAEVYAGAIENRQGNAVAGRALLADALALGAAPGMPARVHVLTEIFYANNEDSRGYRTDRNLALLRSAVAEARARQLPASELALALHTLADDLDLRGFAPEARVAYEELLTLYGSDPLTLCERSDIYAWLAWLDDSQGQIAASLPVFQRAYDGYVACAGPESAAALDQLPYWADALIKSGRAAEAVAMLERALPAWRRVNGANAESAGMLFYLARGYIATGDYPGAERFAGELLALLTGKVAPGDRSLGMAHLALGEALAGEGRNQDARDHAAIALRALSVSVQSAYGRAMLAEAQDLARRVDPPPR